MTDGNSRHREVVVQVQAADPAHPAVEATTAEGHHIRAQVTKHHTHRPILRPTRRHIRATTPTSQATRLTRPSTSITYHLV